MSVISVTLEYGSTRGPRIAPDGSRSYQETWIVRTNNSADRGDIIRNASGLPRQGQQYPEDGGAIVTEVDPVQETEQQKVWRVGIKYESKSTTLPSEDGQLAQNPLERPTVISWSPIRIEKTVPHDLDGKAFVDAAGSPFDPPPVIPSSNLLLTMDRNEAAFIPKTVFQLMNGVNTVRFFGIEPKKALMTGFNAQQGFENGVIFWAVSYNFEVSNDPWIPLLILNAGPLMHPLLPGDTSFVDEDTIVIAEDDNGVSHNANILLNDEGGALNPPGNKGNPPIFIPFRIYEEVDFHILNLP